jgi:hypothetical protein
MSDPGTHEVKDYSHGTVSYDPIIIIIKTFVLRPTFLLSSYSELFME